MNDIQIGSRGGHLAFVSILYYIPYIITIIVLYRKYKILKFDHQEVDKKDNNELYVNDALLELL